MQNPHFKSKIKIPINMSNPFYKSFRVVLYKKNSRKNTKYSRNETMLKIGHHAKAEPMQNPHFWSKIKIPIHMSKSILQMI